MEELKSLFLKISENKRTADLKFILGGLSNQEHLTIGFYANCKTLDVHTKNHVTGEYKPILKMTYFRFFLMVHRLGRLQIKLFLDLLLSNKVNPGRLKRHKLFILPQKTTAEKNEDFLRIQKNGTKFRFNVNKDYNDILKHFLSAEKVVDFRDEASFVYDQYLNYQGFVLNFTFLPGIYFITKKKYNRMGKILLISTYNYLRRTEFESKEKIITELYHII